MMSAGNGPRALHFILSVVRSAMQSAFDAHPLFRDNVLLPEANLPTTPCCMLLPLCVPVGTLQLTLYDGSDAVVAT